MKTESQAYKEHLENKYLPGRDKYLQWFFYPKILRQFNSFNIIDLGCGTGEFLKFLKLNKRAFLGIDNNPFLVEKCVKLGYEVILDDLTKLENIKLPIENALCDNVLEHLDLIQINYFFSAIKIKMAKKGTLIIIVPDKKGFQHDPTHKTFVNIQIIEEMCTKYNVQLQKSFAHPINIKSVGNFFYLNMQVFVIKF
jgi:SAM-dependent methyltransferase